MREIAILHQLKSVEMHGSGQTKTVPIRRTFHATHEAIHPLTHGNVAFHEGVGFGVSLSYAEQLGQFVRF